MGGLNSSIISKLQKQSEKITNDSAKLIAKKQLLINKLADNEAKQLKIQLQINNLNKAN